MPRDSGVTSNKRMSCGPDAAETPPADSPCWLMVSPPAMLRHAYGGAWSYKRGLERRRRLTVRLVRKAAPTKNQTSAHRALGEATTRSLAGLRSKRPKTIAYNISC